MPPDAPRPVIVLAAHGERHPGPSATRRLPALTPRLQPRLPQADIRCSLVNEPGSTTAAIGSAKHALVLPLLFSDGFFFEKLRSELAMDGHLLASPLALWPEFAPFISQATSPADCPLVLVAHGSKRPGRSSQVARQIARDLSSSGRDVRCGFLEEPPIAQSVAAELNGPFDLFGLFFGDGLHGGGDFRALASLPGVRRAITGGEIPGLDQLIETKARECLATIPHS